MTRYPDHYKYDSYNNFIDCLQGLDIESKRKFELIIEVLGTRIKEDICDALCELERRQYGMGRTDAEKELTQ